MSAYGLSLNRGCPTCGALAGKPCTRRDDYGNTHTRRCPCLARIHPGDVQIIDDTPASVDFAEPRHPRGEI